MFKQDFFFFGESFNLYYAHNYEYMCIVSGGGDFIESMSEYMEIWKRDEVVFGYFQEWCKEGLFMTILRCWDFLRRWNGMFMGKCTWIFMDQKFIYELKD